MTGETRSVVVRLSMEASNYIANAQKAGKVGEDAMQRVTRSAQSTDQAIDQLGNTSGKIAAGGIATLLATGKAAVDWESQWAGVTKTVDGTTTQMQDLEDGLRGLATTLPATHEEIAGVAEAAGQLGVAREDIVDFTSTMVDLGETTNLTAEQAATDIAQMANVMGTAGDEVDNLGAALVALGNDGASTEAQILGMAQRIAGAGAQIGLAESDILAIANAAASMGIEVEAGGSAVSRVFTELAKATATGGADLDTFAQVAGMSSQRFVQAFEDDPARAFEAFTSGLDRINKSGGDVFTVLDDLGLADVRVSQALLGMAASGDLLSDSLDLGAQAWEENTALAREAAKRYDTTASQIAVSWNKIRDAGIEAGETLLPVAAGIADAVGTVADAFGELPDPVQSSLTRLIAIGTITAGGAWLGSKVIGAVTSTREAIQGLDTDSTRTGRSLGRLGRAANGAAGGLAALAIIDALQGGFKDTSIGVEAMTNDLLGLQGAAAGGDLPKNLDGLADSIDRLANPNYAQALQDNISDAIGGIGGGSELKEARSQIEAIDLSLSNLVQTAGPDAAADALSVLAEKADLSDSELKDLTSLLPSYKEAMKGAENETRLAADAQVELDDGARTAANGIRYSAEQIEVAAKAYQDAVDAATDTAQAFFGVGEAVADAEVSLAGWTKSLNDQAAALEQFTANSLKAAKRGLDDGLIASLQAAGPEGALRMKQLANATDEEIARANRAWRRGEKAIEEYVDATTEVPPELVTTVSVEDAKARSDIDALEARLRAIKDEDVFVNVRHREYGRNSLGPVDRGADGATVPKTGLGYADRHLYLLADGEEVVSDRHGGATKNRAELKAASKGARLMVVPGLAGGGTAGRRKAEGGGYTPEETEAERRRRERREAIEEQRERDREREAQNVINLEERRREREAKLTEAMISGQEKAAQQLIDAAQAQLTAAESTAASWEQAMQRAGQGATSSFQSTLFGGSQRHGLWTGAGGTGSSWRDALMKDIEGLTERRGLIGQLSAAGLTGAALEALLTQGSNADITQLLQSGQVADFGALYNMRTALTGDVAGAAGQAAYGAEYAAAMGQVAALSQQMLFFQQQLAAITAQRPITVFEAVSAQATAAEVARLQAMAGAA